MKDTLYYPRGPVIHYKTLLSFLPVNHFHQGPYSQRILGLKVANLGLTPKKNGSVSPKFRTPFFFY